MSETIGELVLSHAKKDAGSTYLGLEMLGLSSGPENYYAANLYLAALSMIRRMQKETNKWKHGNRQAKRLNKQ